MRFGDRGYRLLVPLAVLVVLGAGCGGASVGAGVAPSAATLSPATTPPAATSPNADGVMAGDLAGIVADIPAYDPEAPAPSMGAAALQALAVLDPGVVALESDVESAERAALKAALADLPIKPTGSVARGGPLAQRPSAPSALGGSSAVILAVAKLPAGAAVPAAGERATAPAGVQAGSSGDFAVIMTGLVSGLSDMWTPSVPVGAGVSGSGTETIGGARSTLSLDLGRSQDGSTRFGIGIQTDASKGGITAKTDTAASINGLRCPDANGRVKFTVKVRFGADSGATALTQDLTATVTATVNDDATIGESQVDVVQAARRVKDGRQVYVETGVTLVGGTDPATAKFSNLRAIRTSQQATFADISELSGDGHSAALRMGLAALHRAESNWRNGGCVKIQAASPGQVAPGSTTPVGVTVLGRFDGADVPSKLDAMLTGGKSVDPTSMAKTPGTLSYTAPDERDKTATIALTATSRRGIATLALTANTGSGVAYHVTGGLQDFQVNQDVCDITAPFSLDGKVGIAKFSGGLTGTYVATGMFDAHYEGTYVITLPNGSGGSGSMVGTSSGTTAGVAGSGSEQYTLSPLESCG